MEEMYGEATQNSFPRMYLFGDSLTDRAFFQSDNGFGWKLREYYDGRVEVCNCGVSGFTSRWLRDYFDETIIQCAERRGPPAPLLITIFLGANDACLPPLSAHVPLPEFEQHIRHYVDTILENPATKGTRVVLITPPPINVHAPEKSEVEIPSVAGVLESVARNGKGHQSWLSKRIYAERVLKIAQEYESKTDLVTVLDFWKAVTMAGCAEKGDTPEAAANKFRLSDIEDQLPGSGLPGAKEFANGFFTDRLHLDCLGYRVLSRELLDLITTKWPELTRNALPLLE
ncbi:hypothetical protein FQN54_006252 [Arachnomyces sp. PD_36]|nr:hypothetical protein FQN54_006252 [Arachnomyces sp. PD_36]